MNVWELVKPILRPNPGHVAVLAALGLVGMGLTAIETAPTSDASLPLKQGLFAVIALGVMLLVALPHHRVVAHVANPLALAALVLLVLLLVPGLPQTIFPIRNGARRWIDLGVMSIQPSEIAKIAFILALARYLRYRENYRTLVGLITPAVITFVPMALIIVEPDLGTAMVFLPVLASMLIVAGARLKHLVAVALLAAVIAPAMYPLLQPHQKRRIVAIVAQWKGDTRHRTNEGFQGYVAMTAAGAGQITGYGRADAQVVLRFNGLPEAHNDMIFAVICARWGLLGAMAVLGLYLLLIVSALAAAASNKDPFARLVAVGVAAAIFTQVFVNVGMTIGLLPITGMTLPLVSYGGSSLVTTFAMVGLILNTAAHRPLILARSAFEFDDAAAEHG